VAGQDLRVLPAPRLNAKLPKLNLAVASAGDEPPGCARLVSARTDDLSWRNCGRPRNAVHTGATGLEDLVRPGVVLELENRNVAVGGGAGKQAAGLVWCPRDVVHRSSVQSNFVNLLPRRGLLAPDDNLAVVRRRGEDVAVLGVCPGNTPYGAFVSVELSATGWASTRWQRTLSASRLVCGSRPQPQRS
jgi:hypothetical protein